LAKQRKRPARPRRDRKDGPGSGRRKPCPFCRDRVDRVDYKDVSALRRFISERGKMRSRRITGACRRHQSQLALLPYVAEVANERWERGERSGRGWRRDR
jgi:small subunit ribosomal protein S18